MQRKLISIVLAAAVFISCIPPSTIPVFAEDNLSSEEETTNINADEGYIIDSGVCGDNLTWTYYDDGLLEISGTGEMYDFHARYDFSLDQDIIESPWAEYAADINAVALPEGLTYIGSGAFDGTGISTISFPSTLTGIGFWAFRNCENLSGTVVIPEGVTALGHHAFQCTSISSVVLPGTLRVIEYWAFGNCLSLSGVLVIPEGVEIIQGHAFYQSSITGVSLPDSLTTVGEGAFAGCFNLYIDRLPGGVSEIGDAAFSDCLTGRVFFVPQSVTQMGEKSLPSNVGVLVFEGAMPQGSNILECDENIRVFYPQIYADTYTEEGKAELLPFQNQTSWEQFESESHYFISPYKLTYIAGEAFDISGAGWVVFQDGRGLFVQLLEESLLEDSLIDNTGTHVCRAAQDGFSAWFQYEVVTSVDIRDISIKGPWEGSSYKNALLAGSDLELQLVDSSGNSLEPMINTYGYEVRWRLFQPGVDYHANREDIAITPSSSGSCLNIDSSRAYYHLRVIAEEYGGIMGGPYYDWDREIADIIEVVADFYLGDIRVFYKVFEFSILYEDYLEDLSDILDSVPETDSRYNPDYQTIQNCPIVGDSFYVYPDYSAFVVNENHPYGASVDIHISSMESANPDIVSVLYNADLERYEVTYLDGGVSTDILFDYSVEGDSTVYEWNTTLKAKNEVDPFLFWPPYMLKESIQTKYVSKCITTNVYTPTYRGVEKNVEVISIESLTPDVVEVFWNDEYQCFEMVSKNLGECIILYTCRIEGDDQQYSCEYIGHVSNFVMEEGQGRIDSGECGDNLTWELFSDGTLVISGTGDMWDYDAPGFWFDRYIEKISLREGLTSIGSYAFCYLNISEIYIPASVITIGEGAFEGCTSLGGELALPSSVVDIGRRAFYNCKSLIGDLVIPSSVVSIGNEAFSYTGISGVQMPEPWPQLGSWVFLGCHNLEEDYSPKHGSCGDNLTWEILDNGTLEISGTGRMTDYESIYNFEKDRIITDAPWADNRDKIDVVHISEGVTSIGKRAFEGMLISEVSIPETLEEIGDYAFCSCVNLDKELKIPQNVTHIGFNAFPPTVEFICFMGAAPETNATTYCEGIAFYSSYFAVEYTDEVKHQIGPALTWIEVSADSPYFNEPQKKEYALGEVFNPLGSFWVVPSENGQTIEFIEEFEVSGFDPQQVGERILTATWGEYTIDFSIYGVEESHESEMTLTVTSNQLYSGGESQVSIEVNGDTTISACQFVLLYDASALQLVSCEAGELLKEDAPTINTSIPGMIYFSWDSLTAIQADGSLLDITFTTTADPEDMQTHLLIPSESPEYGFVFADENLNSISVEVIDGTIEIKNILYGDVNLDGTVNVVDANIIRRYAALLMELNDESLKSADVNGDGVVNIIDANLIRRYVAMLISEFPAER